MRTRLRSKVTLLFAVSALLLTIPAVAALAQDTGTSTAAPTIQSHKADYAPGELVTLTGSGWRSGESVHINVNDEEGQTWTRNVDVTADASGNIHDSFNLPDRFVATYKVTATGAESGVVTTTFTDSNVHLAANLPFGDLTFVRYEFYPNTSCTAPSSCGSSDPGLIIPGSPFTAPIIRPFANVQSITFMADPATYFGKKAFENWTVSSPIGAGTITNLSTDGRTICASGFTSGDDVLTFIANYAGAATNVAPVANNDSYSVNEDDTLTVNSQGVLGNDTDADNNPLTATLVSGPSNGSVTLDANGSFTYTPEADYNGPESFTYRANDGTADSNVATVTINVASVNDAPTCQNVAIETAEDEQGSAAAECSDADGDTLTYEIVDQAADGTATTDGGDLKYDPEPNFNGSDSFTYRASDGIANSDPATVDVTVSAANDAPTTPGAITSDEALNNDGAFTLNWGASTDVDGDEITYTLEKRDSDDANWSEVASGLTSSSYTYGSSNAQEEGTWDFRVKAVDSPAGAESDYSTAENLVKVDKSGPNAPTLSFATAGQSVKATVNGVDWYKDSAKVDLAANGDPALADTSDGSSVDAASLQPNPFDVTQNGTSTVSKKVKDNANNESAAGTLEANVDAANPTLDNCPTTGSFILNSGGGTQSVGSINASDGESGVDNTASTLSGSVNTSTVGEKTVTFTAKDNVGHSATKQCSYSVIFNFDGFRSPVDNPGTGSTPVFNSAKAGQSIPVKFGLGGNQGLNIIAAGYPKVTSVNCVTSATVDPIEEYATSTAEGGLTYEATANQYKYVWKTQSTYVNKCFKVDLQLTDGTSHVAYFKFLK